MDPENIRNALVVGAGVMGHSIAQAFAQAGIDVNLVDLEKKALERAMDLVKSNLDTLADSGRISSQEITSIIDRIHLSTDLTAAAQGVEFALEAVSEVADVKKKVFFQLDQVCPGDAILASNTSGLNIFDIADVERPERLIITHWFAPPHIIPLVEVVPGPETLPKIIDATVKLMERLGKKPVLLKQFVPSFIVNRIQNQIFAAVLEMLEKGWADPVEIDFAVKNSLGIRLPIVGVVQTMDFAGLDLIHDATSGVGLIVPIIEEKVKKGRLGVKTSKGFYDYSGRSEAEILRERDRLYLQLLDYLQDTTAFEPV